MRVEIRAARPAPSWFVPSQVNWYGTLSCSDTSRLLAYITLLCVCVCLWPPRHSFSVQSAKAWPAPMKDRQRRLVINSLFVTCRSAPSFSAAHFYYQLSKSSVIYLSVCETLKKNQKPSVSPSDQWISEGGDFDCNWNMIYKKNYNLSFWSTISFMTEMFTTLLLHQMAHCSFLQLYVKR